MLGMINDDYIQKMQNISMFDIHLTQSRFSAAYKALLIYHITLLQLFATPSEEREQPSLEHSYYTSRSNKNHAYFVSKIIPRFIILMIYVYHLVQLPIYYTVGNFPTHCFCSSQYLC